MSETETKKEAVRRFAGADWLRTVLKYRQPTLVLTEFGERVANLLGDVWYGLYHLPEDKLVKVDWGNPCYIIVPIPYELATFDDAKLTNLVILAHEYSLRVAVQPQSKQYLRLLFHPRAPGAKEFHKRHPTIEEAVQTCRNYLR